MKAIEIELLQEIKDDLQALTYKINRLESMLNEPELDLMPEPEPLPTPQPIEETEPELIEPQPIEEEPIEPQSIDPELNKEEHIEPEPNTKPIATTEAKPVSTLADSIHQTNEALADSISNRHIDDLSKALTLSDRFLFLKELFHGDSNTMNETFNALNECENAEAAEDYLSENFSSWDPESDTVRQFLVLLSRKFK